MTYEALREWVTPHGQPVFGSSKRMSRLVSSFAADTTFGLFGRCLFFGVDTDPEGAPPKAWVHDADKDVEIASTPLPDSVEALEAWLRMIATMHDES